MRWLPAWAEHGHQWDRLLAWSRAQFEQEFDW